MKNSVKLLIIAICSIMCAINIIFFFKINAEKKKIDNVADKVNMDSIQNIQNTEDKKGDNLIGDNNEEDSKMRITLCEGFYYEPISEEIKSRIDGISYKENDKIHYSDLRFVTVMYYDFNREVKEGEMIVNVQVADDVLAIFKELYDNQYQIEKMRLIDEYNADDDASMEDNNTSAFNYRTIDGTDDISDHSYGVAIDINPLYNPYVRKGHGDRNVLPVNGSAYADRNAEFDHKIVKGDICYNAFISRGWKWGGEWTGVVDYQHFYKEIN